MKRIKRWYALSLVLFSQAVLLSLGISREWPYERSAQAQAECTTTVEPSGSLQVAINRATEGDVICLTEGEWTESLKIRKALVLQGQGAKQSVIRGQVKGQPVLWIESDSQIEVQIKDLAVTGAPGEGCADSPVCPDGLLVRGHARVTLENVRVFGNRWAGLKTGDRAQVRLIRSQVVDNSGRGLEVWSSAVVLLQHSQVSGNGFDGLWVWELARIVLTNSQVTGNRWAGLRVWDSAHVSLMSSQVARNGKKGLEVGGWAQVEVRGSTLEDNGTDLNCVGARWICNGIEVRDEAHLTLEGSIVRANADWGLAAMLMKCGYKEDDFTGEVVFQGENTVEGNNISGDQNGRGNPGDHPWNQPDIPDGQVCLP
jgi:hypothetical protein